MMHDRWSRHLSSWATKLRGSYRRHASGWRAALLCAGAVCGVHLTLWLLLALAHAGSVGALLAAVLLTVAALPVVLVGWPVVQGFLLYAAAKCLHWRHRGGLRLLLWVNAATFAAGLTSCLLLVGFWPRRVADVGARLGQTLIVEHFSRAGGTLACVTYPLGEPGNAVAVALPPGMLRLTLSGFRPGELHVAVRGIEAAAPPLVARPVYPGPAEEVWLQPAPGFTTFTSTLSVLTVGTGSVTRHQPIQPFPRELVLLRTPAPAGRKFTVLERSAEVRDTLLYGDRPHAPPPSAAVTLTVEELQPSIADPLLLGLLLSAAVATVVVAARRANQHRPMDADAQDGRPRTTNGRKDSTEQ